MHRRRSVLNRTHIIVPLALFLVAAAGCSSRPVPTVTPSPIVTTPVPLPVLVTSTPSPVPTAVIASTPSPEQLTSWPTGSFRYEERLKPSGQGGGQETLVSGRYREGSWQENARTGGGASQELIVSGGDSYTRPAGEATWTHWPGIGFDAAYGLTAPLTVLRLYPLAGRSTRPVLDLVPGAPEPTFRVESLITAATVKQVMQAGVRASIASAAGQSSLSAQLASTIVDQTITYWRGESGRVYQASASLMAAGSDGSATPWMEVTWRFWNYDDPEIVVSAPAQSRPAVDASGGQLATPGSDNEAASAKPTRTALAPASAAGAAKLTVDVFAAPGIPAENLAVTVYPAGDADNPVETLADPSARFSLAPGRYDVRVQMNYAEQWLRGLDVSVEEPNRQSVTFDFGTLQLSVQRGGAAIPVDIVTYPAGDRQDWVDRRSDNPASIALRAGTYDVEITYVDQAAKQTVEGLVIKAGAVIAKTIEVP